MGVEVVEVHLKIPHVRLLLLPRRASTHEVLWAPVGKEGHPRVVVEDRAALPGGLGGVHVVVVTFSEGAETTVAGFNMQAKNWIYYKHTNSAWEAGRARRTCAAPAQAAARTVELNTNTGKSFFLKVQADH